MGRADGSTLKCFGERSLVESVRSQDLSREYDIASMKTVVGHIVVVRLTQMIFICEQPLVIQYGAVFVHRTGFPYYGSARCLTNTTVSISSRLAVRPISGIAP